MKSKYIRNLLLRYSRPAILLLLAIFFTLVTDTFWRPGEWKNLSNIVLMQAPFLILMSVSMMLSIILKGIDLSIGSSIALLGCLVGFILQAHGSAVFAIVAGLAAGATVGLINGFLISKVKVSPFIATYSMQWILRGGAMLLLGGKQIYDLGPTFAKIFVSSDLTILAITLVIILIMSFILRRTVFGHQIYATGINESAARISGIKTDRVIMLTYIISGLIIGLTSVMYTAYLGSAEPIIGTDFPIRAIAATLVGGAAMGGGDGKVSNAVIGSFIMLTLSNGMIHMGVPSVWQSVIVGFVIILAILLERVMQKLTFANE